MRKVICQHCRENQQAPDDAAQTSCTRCGRTLALASGISLHPEIALDEDPQPAPADGQATQRYGSWEEFSTRSPIVRRVLADLAGNVQAPRGLKVRPLPEETPPIIDEWGEPIGSFATPGDARFIVHGVSAMSAAFGLFMEFGLIQAVRENEMGIGEILVAELIVVLPCFAFAYWLSFWRDPNYAAVYWVFNDGILWQAGGKLSMCHWDEVTNLRLSRQSDGLRLSLDLPPAFKRSMLMDPFRFGRLVEFMTARVAEAKFLSCLQQIYQGKRVDFGVLWADRDGITDKKFARAPLVWAELERVVCEDATLYIDCGGRQKARRIPLAEVADAQVLSAIARVMIREGNQLPPMEA